MKTTHPLVRSAWRVLGATALLGSAVAWAADGYPNRPLRFVLGFPPGGTSDIVARAVGEHLAAALGQNVVIDNRPGASGNIAAELAARAPADGHTLLLSSGTYAVAPSLYRQLPYDFVRGFDQVTLLAGVPFMLAVTPKLPAKSLGDLLAMARAKPGTINFASSGTGTPAHLAGELLRQSAGIDIVHVPYKGTAAAVLDLIAGRVQFYFTSFPGAMPHVKAGRLRAIAVTGASRSPLLPALPTVQEAGIAGYRAGSWYGLAVPAGSPAAAIARLHAEVQKGLAPKGTLDGVFTSQGLETMAGASPADAARFVREEMDRWARVVQRAGLKPR